MRYAEDLAVAGEAVWNRREQRYHATMRLSGKRNGVLGVAWPSVSEATAAITGRLGGRPVRLQTPAP